MEFRTSVKILSLLAGVLLLPLSMQMSWAQQTSGSSCQVTSSNTHPREQKPCGPSFGEASGDTACPQADGMKYGYPYGGSIVCTAANGTTTTLSMPLSSSIVCHADPQGKPTPSCVLSYGSTQIKLSGRLVTSSSASTDMEAAGGGAATPGTSERRQAVGSSSSSSGAAPSAPPAGPGAGAGGP